MGCEYSNVVIFADSSTGEILKGSRCQLERRHPVVSMFRMAQEYYTGQQIGQCVLHNGDAEQDRYSSQLMTVEMGFGVYGMGMWRWRWR